MSNPPRVVYLEDLEHPAPTATKENVTVTVTEASAGDGEVVETELKVEVKSTSSPSTANSVAKKTATGATKRQMSLTDMMSSSSSNPKVAKTNIPALNSIPFSMSEYKKGMTEEQMKLLELECDTMGKSWLKVLKDEIKKPYFLDLKRFLYAKGVKGPDSIPKPEIYPAPNNIYTWSNLTPLGRVKVVIIGQDPYHNPGQAHGLCFSVPSGVTKLPPSLLNIYKEIKAEYPAFEPPKHGNLTAWAENGVLLLNSVLTVEKNQAGSHQKRGWEKFTAQVIDVVDRYGGANLGKSGGFSAGRGRGIVFLAWGSWAAQCVAKLDKKKHLILTSAHPSPLSAHRGFIGNGHFKKANDWLEEKYGPDGCVDWTKL